jgi:hypothetical protein
MAPFEYKPPARPEYNDSLRVVREVVGVPQDFNARLTRDIKMLKYIDLNDVDIILGSGSSVTLIEADEIINLYRAVDVEPTHDSLGDLDDYLTEQLRHSILGGPLSIAIRPIDDRFDSKLVDSKQGEIRADYANFKSPPNSRLDHERDLVQRALCRFFEVDLESDELGDVWSSSEHSDVGRLVVAHVVGFQNILNMKPLLDETKALPLGVMLAPVSVHEV